MSKAFVKEVEAKEEPVKVETVKVAAPVITKTAIGVIMIKDKMYRLFAGEDKKWYKQEQIGTTRIDPINNTPEISVWSEDIVPFTKKEFEAYFGKVKTK